MARGLKFQKKRDGTIYLEKTKALISYAVTVQLTASLFSPMQKQVFSRCGSYGYVDKTSLTAPGCSLVLQAGREMLGRYVTVSLGVMVNCMRFSKP